ncbi:hypothetical protein [Enterovibrio baiacu]|uniref:hypothetical protein n=1 Tax=Enterovibrio baiacu TaxID=2491023 RepID=UPI003D09B040
MWKFIVDNMVIFLVSSICLLLGLLIGLIVTRNPDGLFVHISFDDKDIVKIGSLNKNELILDLSKINGTQAKAIRAQLERLPPEDNALSQELRDMVRIPSGPYQSIEKEIIFHLVRGDNSNNNGTVCMKSKLFNNTLLAVNPGPVLDNPQSFKARRSRVGCSENQLNSIWVDRVFFENWHGKPIDGDSVKLKAYIYATSL